MNNRLEIGANLKKLRKERKMSQEDMANLLGYSHKSVISHIENGDRDMTMEKILILIKEFQLEINDLLGAEETEKEIQKERKRIKKEKIIKERYKDILFEIDETLFSYRVCGALIKNSQILLTKGGEDYSLPGGHVKINELSEDAIKREIKEETNLDVTINHIVATNENFWKWDDKVCHQICIFYHLSLIDENQEMELNPDTPDTKYLWVNLCDLDKINLYPMGIKEKIINNVKCETHFISK